MLRGTRGIPPLGRIQIGIPQSSISVRSQLHERNRIDFVGPPHASELREKRRWIRTPEPFHKPLSNKDRIQTYHDSNLFFV